MIREWEKGAPAVIGIKTSSEEHKLMYWLRTRYYRMIRRLSELETYEHFTGFGLYDRKAIEIVRQIDDPTPYFRGIIAEIGLPHVELPYTQAVRERGKSHNNLYTLYDPAMLGITNLSRVPLRIATFTGFVCALLSISVAAVYFAYKLLFWNRFSVDMAPLVIGAFFFPSIQLTFLGIVGEYIETILTAVQHRPLVIERERINFEYAPVEPVEGDRAITD
jgi:polyisoprenyl-phosphate glycosyltransferase